MLPSNSAILRKILVQAKSSDDLLASKEDDLFEIFKKASNVATFTCSGATITAHCLPEASIALSIDLEAAKEYFRDGNPYIPRDLHLK